MTSKDEAWLKWEGPDVDPVFFRVDPLGMLRDRVPGRGDRRDIRELLASVTSYAEALEADIDTVARGRNVILDHFKLIAARTHRDRPRTVIWIYGGPGVGKSRLALAYAKK